MPDTTIEVENALVTVALGRSRVLRKRRPEGQWRV